MSRDCPHCYSREGEEHLGRCPQLAIDERDGLLDEMSVLLRNVAMAMSSVEQWQEWLTMASGTLGRFTAFRDRERAATHRTEYSE